MKTTGVNSIRTLYHGVEFRSRTEARWAVYFDLCGCRWEYEPEGYSVELPDGNVKYLPDFYVHNVKYRNQHHDGLIVEVKGVMDDYDLLKILSFSRPTCARHCSEINKDGWGFNCKKCSLRKTHVLNNRSSACTVYSYMNSIGEYYTCPQTNREVENPLYIVQGFPKSFQEMWDMSYEYKPGYPYTYLHIDGDMFECLLLPDKEEGCLVLQDTGDHGQWGDNDLADKFLSIASSVKFEELGDYVFEGNMWRAL